MNTPNPTPIAESLKPCPFCGGDAHLQPQQGNNPRPYSYDVIHHCQSGFFRFSPKGAGVWTEAEAIAAWNTRPSPSADDGDVEGLAAYAAWLDATPGDDAKHAFMALAVALGRPHAAVDLANAICAETFARALSAAPSRTADVGDVDRIDIRAIALGAMKDAHRAGESNEMCARWISERVRNAAAPSRAAPAGDREGLSAYDAGLLSDHGGGNVEWWQDYIRAELSRAHDHYAALFESGSEGLSA